MTKDIYVYTSVVDAGKVNLQYPYLMAEHNAGFSLNKQGIEMDSRRPLQELIYTGLTSRGILNGYYKTI